MDFIAQAIGIVAMAANILAFQFKNKKTLIICQLMGSVLFAVNMFMLNAVMGGIMNILGIARALVYLKKDDLKIPIKTVNILFVFAYAIFYVMVFTVFGKEPTTTNIILELLPAIGSSAMALALSRNSTRAVRLCGFINSPCWLIYNSVNFSIGGILCEIFGLISVISSLIRIDILGKKNKKENS